MRLARVHGQVVATAKEPALEGYKLLLVRDVVESDPHEGTGSAYVALDLVGAGEGELVLVTTGSAARVTGPLAEVPTDSTVVAIADTVIWQGDVTYRK